MNHETEFRKLLTVAHRQTSLFVTFTYINHSQPPEVVLPAKYLGIELSYTLSINASRSVCLCVRASDAVVLRSQANNLGKSSTKRTLITQGRFRLYYQRRKINRYVKITSLM